MVGRREVAVISRAPRAFQVDASRPRPVRIASTQRFQRRAYRPSYKRPFIGERSPQLGALTDVPMSIGMGAAGVGSLLLSGILPSPVKTIAQVAGVGLIAFGAINLFPTRAQAKTTEESSGPEPIGEQATFNAVTATILEPSWNSSIPRGFWSSDYDVKVKWDNPTDKKINVDFQVYAEETPIWMGVFSDEVGEAYRSVVHSGRVDLQPRSKETVSMEIPIMHPEGAGDATAVTMSVRKVRQNQIVEVDSVTFTVYANAIARFFDPRSYF